MGEYLKSVRIGLSVSLDEAAKKAQMSRKFLELLEQGRILELPTDVYVIGFLKQLSGVYKIEAEPLFHQYKKEKNIQEQLSSKKEESKKNLTVFLKKIIVTPKLLSIIGALIFIVSSLVYIIWQVVSINRAPSLEIFEPKDQQIVSQSFTLIKGKTDPGVSLDINGQSVFVDSSGKFETQLGLSEGVKELVFSVRNKFEKTAVKVLRVTSQQAKVEEGGVLLELAFSSKAQVKYRVDDGQLEEVKDFSGGESIQISAKNKIILSVSDAGAVTAVLNGKYLGQIGRSSEELLNITFSSENATIENSK